MSDYNTTKKCLDPKCGWANTYDKDDDWRHVGDLEKCPRCGGPVETIPYKPRY